MVKNISFIPTALVIAGSVLIYSCKKETCPGCRERNEPPNANAGSDQVVALPVDSILLDGAASSDREGRISEFHWTKISGPASFKIINPAFAMTVVRNLSAGIYQFELKVKDNAELFAKDTVRVVVFDPSSNNPPMAGAGDDQTITLPINSVTLDGSGSTDPDNNIGAYGWTKISGPLSLNIANANAAQTTVSNLIEGIYEFELTVSDIGGVFSTDTVQITVLPAPYTTACDGSIRQQVAARLTHAGYLSIVREGMTVATAGNKILFAGGYTGNYTNGWEYYSRVDIFDITSKTWTAAELSQARWNMATAVVGNKIYFGGGIVAGGYSSRVDIYDAVTNAWSITNLSIPRSEMAGAAAGNKIVFAGGIGQGFFSPHWPASPVDIYNTSTNRWSAESLPGRPTGDIIGLAGIAATTIGNKIYFAGNASDWFAWDFGSISSTINIYDASINVWSISDLSIPRGFMAGIAVGTKNYWAGGLHKQPYDPFTNLVEIRDETTGQSAFSCLFQPNAFFSAVLKDNKIVFFTSGVNIPGYWSSQSPVMNKFDIYDISSNSWSIGVLSVDIYGSSVISMDNTIYIAGGYVNDELSGQVWKLEF